MRITKKYVKNNTSISKIHSVNNATLEGCRFNISSDLQNIPNDNLFKNLIKWGWVVDKGRLCITYKGLENLRMV